MKIVPKINKISSSQATYIEILFNDLIFSLKQRQDFLITRYGKRFISDLFMYEAADVIRDLKRLKDEKKEKP